MLAHDAPAITERLNMKADMKRKLEAVLSILDLQHKQLESMVADQQEFVDDCPDSRSEEKIQEADELLESLEEARDIIEAARDAVEACLPE
jgi:hypothetical protein